MPRNEGRMLTDIAGAIKVETDKEHQVAEIQHVEEE